MINHSSFNSFACSYVNVSINCFLKAHNKQLNQYCLNFIFFYPKIKSFKKLFGFRSGRRLGRVDPQKHRLDHESTRFCVKSKKIKFESNFSGPSRVGSEYSNPFCHVSPKYTKLSMG